MPIKVFVQSSINSGSPETGPIPEKPVEITPDPDGVFSHWLLGSIRIKLGETNQLSIIFDEPGTDAWLDGDKNASLLFKAIVQMSETNFTLPLEFPNQVVLDNVLVCPGAPMALTIVDRSNPGTNQEISQVTISYPES